MAHDLAHRHGVRHQGLGAEEEDDVEEPGLCRELVRPVLRQGVVPGGIVDVADLQPPDHHPNGLAGHLEPGEVVLWVPPGPRRDVGLGGAVGGLEEVANVVEVVRRLVRAVREAKEDDEHALAHVPGDALVEDQEDHPELGHGLGDQLGAVGVLQDVLDAVVDPGRRLEPLEKRLEVCGVLHDGGEEVEDLLRQVQVEFAALLV
mmetsp:Transcript_120073/g.340421  ORF Transcript_120073/g.340421 Transcript_120073/m.340421 type:complete len:204 (-) Transcript_120073:197-808(-)